jgi:hypothetical protein
MADTTITSANSVVTLTVPGLFPTPVQLSGYSADRAWETADQELSESQIGVDGRKTAGFVFQTIDQTFTLQADSPSKAVFKAIQTAMQTAQEIFYITGEIALPSTGETFTGTQGTLQRIKPMPDGGRVLQPVAYVINWGRLTPGLI